MEQDPLEGFQVTAYDEATEMVTIQIDRRLLKTAAQQSAVADKCIEIIQHGPNVRGVHVDPRPESKKPD